MITIKSKLAYRSVYIALSAIIIFSLLIFYLPTTAKAVNISLNGVRSTVYQGTVQAWNAQFDFYPSDHPGIQDNGGSNDFLPFWSKFRVIVHDSNGAQVAWAQFGWEGEIEDATPHFLLSQNQQDGGYYFQPNPAASTDVGYGYGFGNPFNPIGYGYGFQVGNTPSGYGVFSHTWMTSLGYGAMAQGGGMLLYEPPGPRYEVNFHPLDLPEDNYTVQLIIDVPDDPPYVRKRFLSDNYGFKVEYAQKNPGPATSSPPEPNVKGKVNKAGVFTDNAVIKSGDGKVTIKIPVGTVGLVGGVPIENISIDKVTDPPPPPPGSTFIGISYDLGPSGATFDPAIEITFEPGDIPPGAATVAYYDEDAGEWVELDTEAIVFNPDGSITAHVTHFTYFSVLVRTAPASFTASDLSITPSEVDIAERVTISAKVTNTGDLAGEYDVILKINGEQVSHGALSLDGGSTETVTFVNVQGKPGTYTVSLNGISGMFTVRPVSTEPIIIRSPAIPPLTVEYPPPTPPAPAPTPTLPGGFGAVSWWVILLIVVASVVVIGGSLWLLVFRRGA